MPVHSRIFNRTSKSVENHIARLNKRAAATAPIVTRKVSPIPAPAPVQAPVQAPVPFIPAGPRYTATRPTAAIAQVAQRPTGIPRPNWHTAPRTVTAKPAPVNSRLVCPAPVNVAQRKSALKKTTVGPRVNKQKKTVTFAGDDFKTTSEFRYAGEWAAGTIFNDPYPSNCKPHFQRRPIIEKQNDGSLVMTRYRGVYRPPKYIGTCGPTGHINRIKLNEPTNCLYCRETKASQFLPIISEEALQWRDETLDQDQNDDLYFHELWVSYRDHTCITHMPDSF